MNNPKTNIRKRLKEIIAEQLGLELELVSDDASIADDLGADSLEMVQIMMEIEEAFEIEIQDSVSEGLVTVDDTANFVAEILAEQSRG